jgi:Lsr2
MAREIVFTDDISGEHGAEPVRIGWNDVWFEVDLAEKNRAKLTEFIETYINAGRPSGRDDAPARTRAARGTGAPKHALTEEDYGFPRRGRASAEEQNYVKTHLTEVNARLKAAGVREIDPSDEKLKARYGL